MIEGFDRHYRLFRATSANAKERFERRRLGGGAAGGERADPVLRRAGAGVRRAAERRARRGLARRRHLAGGEAALHRPARRPQAAGAGRDVLQLGRHAGDAAHLRPQRLRVRPGRGLDRVHRVGPADLSQLLPGRGGLRTSLRDIFVDFGWNRPFADLERDVGFVWQALLRALRRRVAARSSRTTRSRCSAPPSTATRPPTWSGRSSTATTRLPFVVGVLHDDDGRLVLDAVAASTPSSISRALLALARLLHGRHGRAVGLRPVPAVADAGEAALRALHDARARASRARRSSIRDLLQHLHHSRDVFVEAPGIAGMVMLVFTLPSYPYVFKVIKDEFGHAKDTDRATVKRKFLMVKQIDRVGRMADTLEFTNLALPRDRFAPELLDELLALAPSMIEDRRRQRDRRPLLRRAADDAAQHLPRRRDARGGRRRRARVRRRDPRPRDREHLPRRHALAELRRHPPRPGRLLRLRRDRVPHRLQLPARSRRRRTPRRSSSGEPWYPVGAARRLPGGVRDVPARRPAVREAFLRHHAELLAPEFWQHCQAQVEAARSSTSSPTRRRCASAGASSS